MVRGPKFVFLIFVFVCNYVNGSPISSEGIPLGGDTLEYLSGLTAIDLHLLNILKNNKTNINYNDLLEVRRADSEELPNKIKFKYFKDGASIYNGTGQHHESLEEIGCKSSDKFSFIFHGWRQDCNFMWVQMLTEKLTKYRGGCVICVDYGYYSNDSYFRLIRNLKPISDTVVNKLNHFASQGFDATENGYMMGFSFGGQMASAIGRSFGVKKFRNIDTCDMAGPGFDYKEIINHRDAAQNVHCLHTTRDRGTKLYNCHQNIRLGNCGYSQPAGRNPMYSSHGVCVFMYISSFDHPFYVVEKPPKCTSANPARWWPDKYKIGYNANITNLPSGELFVLTSGNYPYNVLHSAVVDPQEQSQESLAIDIRITPATEQLNVNEIKVKPELKPIIAEYRIGRYLKQHLLQSFIKVKQFFHSFY